MADNRAQPSWRTSAGGPARPDKKYGWKPADPAGPGGGWKRPLKLFGLAAGGVGLAGGIVWLILLILAPARPGLIAVGADPRQAADRLDVPYDPYGWLGGKRLLEWAKAANAADKQSPVALADAPEWLDGDEWVDKVRRDAKVDPVVVYVGLHGGVAAGGKPVLYTGRVDAAGAPAVVRLADVVGRLGDDPGLREKRKVLVLDAGRGPPDPTLGEVNHDFVRAVRADPEVQERIRATPHLVVVCGADDGQRAWESADLGMSALAYHLMKGLAGDAAPPDMKSFTAAHLYEYVRDKVGDWAKNNRPTAQEPVLFPDPKADNRAAADYDKRVFIKTAGGRPPAEVATPGPADLPADVLARWKQAADLAQAAPPPAAYTPLAWRRYRELLLRYEQAAMAGDGDGKGKLATALDRLAERIAHDPLTPAATGWTLTLPAAAGRPARDRLPDTLADLARPGNTTPLGGAAARVKGLVAGRPARPVEAHLLLMTNFFYAEVAKEEPPGELWRDALRARLAAERAAVGAQPGSDRYPYSERVWPLVRAKVLEADAARRTAEDLMFAGTGGGPDYHAQARDKFAEAGKGYAETLAAVRAYQDGLRARDELYADLPFLGRWVAEAEVTPAFAAGAAHEKVAAAWVDGHRLTDKLDEVAGRAARPTPDDGQAVAALAGRAAGGLKEVKDLFKEQVDKAKPVADQPQLQAILPLLLVPAPVLDADGKTLFGADDRAKLVRYARRIEQDLHRNNTPLANQPRQQPADKIKRRAELAMKALGDTAWKAKVGAERQHLDVLPLVVGELLNNRTGLEDTARAAEKIAGHWAFLADAAAAPAARPDEQARVERFGRLAVAVADPAGPEEPATVHRRARWRALVDGQAARIALDHWYAEDGKTQTFAQAAKALLADGRAAAPTAPPGPDAATAAALLRVPPLTLAAEVAGGQAVGSPGEETVRWTTEPSRDVRLDLAGGGPPLTGTAVLWAGSTAKDWLAVTAGPRQPVPLPPPGAGPGVGPAVRVVAGETVTKSLTPETKTVRVAAAGFFRGQPLDAGVTFAVNSRPDLVVTEARPDPGAMIALRADDDLEPGAISIVLDFSGSMVQTPTGQPPRHPDTHDWQKDPQTKMWLAVDALKSVLKTLPRKTKVSVRVFSHVTQRPQRNEPKAPFTQKVFPFEDGSAAYQDRAREVVQKLESFYPYWNTPLVDAIREAVDDRDALPDADTPQTLLVLTDGANTQLGDRSIPADDVGKPEWVAEVRQEVKALKARIKPNLAVHMVFFSAGREEDIARAMFKDLEGVNEGRASASKLWSARDVETLRERLDRILRPKPRLLDPLDQVVEQLPRFGLPVNRASEGAGRLWWYGPEKIPTGTTGAYSLEYSKGAARLRLRAGDRMVVRLSGREGAPDGRVTFHREVYYRDVDPATPGRRTAENPAWHLAVPGYSYERPNEHYLLLTAALEGKAGAREGVLSHARPPFLWWELSRLPAGRDREQPSDGTVYVRNVARGQHPAPCWRVVAADGPEARMKDVPNRLRVWALDPPEPVGGRALEVANPVQLQGAPRAFKVGNDVTVQVSLEDIPFYPDPPVDNDFHRQAGDRRRCLVVRAADRAGRVLQARVPELENQVEVKEHRYFYVKDGKHPPGPRPLVGGYTGVFGPLAGDDVFAGLDRLSVELISVTDATADRDKALTLDLDPAGFETPRPVRIEPGERGTVNPADFK